MGLMWLSIRTVCFMSPQLMLYFRTKMPFSISEKMRSWPIVTNFAELYHTYIREQKCPVNIGKFNF